MYATCFYISYSFLCIPLISRYPTHFSISVYHIIVSYTTFTQDLTPDLTWNLTQDFAGDLTGNLTQDFAGDLLLWVYRAGYLAPDLQRNFAPDLQRNFAGDLTWDLAGCLRIAYQINYS